MRKRNLQFRSPPPHPFPYEHVHVQRLGEAARGRRRRRAAGISLTNPTAYDSNQTRKPEQPLFLPKLFILFSRPGFDLNDTLRSERPSQSSQTQSAASLPNQLRIFLRMKRAEPLR